MEETEELSKPDESVAAETGYDTKADVKALISPERAQQFQLLIHLVSNRQQPLVLSGPEGIGKTTVINLLQQRKGDLWHICTIKAEAHLDLKQIQQVLIRSVGKKEPGLQGSNNWNEIMAYYGKSGQKLVLILDEAGMLAPGLMGELCKFSDANPVLRIVFALTPDQLHVIHSSDKSIYDCFFIEFPPLTEKQCGVFLQNLSCKPGSAVNIKSINPEMVENLYRETHGIPGRIVTAFSGSSRFSSENQSTGSSLLLGAVLIAALVGFVWWSGGTDLEQGENSSLSEKGSTTIISAPAFNASGRKNIEIEIVDDDQKNKTPQQINTEKKPFSGKMAEPIVGQGENTDNRKINQVFETAQPTENKQEKTYGEGVPGESASITNQELKDTKPVPEEDHLDIISIKNDPGANVVIEESVPEAVGETAVDHGETTVTEQKTLQHSNDFEETESPVAVLEQTASTVPSADEIKAALNSNVNWVLQQPSTNFTLQLMVLSRFDSLVEVIHKYPVLRKDFRYFKMNSPSRTKYYVLYGSFDGRSDAVRTMQSLPKELQQAWMRRFSGVQNKIREKRAN